MIGVGPTHSWKPHLFGESSLAMATMAMPILCDFKQDLFCDFQFTLSLTRLVVAANV